ncbi:MAG: lipoyl(octanoyl) transferase LipB [Mucinivorans sp.]
MVIEVINLGTIEYAKAWELQNRYFEALQHDSVSPMVLLLCEHPHVYTLGKSGHINNLLVDDVFLSKIGASYFKTDRGGDITYHGPGQVVGYPILNLTTLGLGLKEYISQMEQAVIDTVAHWGIKAMLLDGATGVWLCDERGERKICAIGVRASRFITMHGFALNVNTDLDYFRYINPCGFVDKGVTSMRAEGVRCSVSEVSELFAKLFCERIKNKKLYNEQRAKTLGSSPGG